MGALPHVRQSVRRTLPTEETACGVPRADSV